MISAETIAAVTALVAAVAAAFTKLGGWLQRRKDRALEVEESEIVRLRADVAEVKKEASAARALHAACEDKVEALERRLEAVEQHHPSLMARWIKDKNKRVIWINARAMISIFAPLGYGREEIEGRTFAEIGFDPNVATEIDRLDQAALMRSGEAVSTLLTLRRLEAPPGVMTELRPMVVVKVAGIGRDGELIYEGYAFLGNARADTDELGDRRQDEQRGASKLRTGAAAAG